MSTRLAVQATTRATRALTRRSYHSHSHFHTQHKLPQPTSTPASTWLRQHSGVITGSCLGLSVGAGMSLRSAPRIRMDSGNSFSTSSSSNGGWRRGRAEGGTLDPDLVRQLSGGSVAGFLSGLLVSVFSRTLVLLFGAGVVLVQVASRYGINIIDQLRLKQRIGNSRVLAVLQKDPAFKVSFGLFFALSAFMHF